MPIFHHLCDIPPEARGGVVCIGNFDGVHLGHAAMLRTARRTARDRNLPLLVVTFDPHPLQLLRPEIPRPYLTTIGQRLALIGAFAPEAIWLIRPDKNFLATSAQAFETDILAAELRASVLVEGSSFTYGKGALGNTQSLRSAGTNLGWQVVEIATTQGVLSDQTIVDVSSTLSRWLIGHGRMRDAQILLGRPYALAGTVIHGKGRGASVLGYPTINLQSHQLLPADGVYAGEAVIAGSAYRAAISVGNNPTFGDTGKTVEAFLLDFAGNVYDQAVELVFRHWLRDQHTFPSVALLSRQIGRDVHRIKALSKVAGESG